MCDRALIMKGGIDELTKRDLKAGTTPIRANCSRRVSLKRASLIADRSIFTRGRSSSDSHRDHDYEFGGHDFSTTECGSPPGQGNVGPFAWFQYGP